MARETFLSHRGSDIKIVDVIRDHLQRWGLSADSVFQYSYSGGAGLRVGGNLEEELGRKLSAAKIIILVFTLADEDWSYCMWECGVAMNPNKEEQSTRIIVFQCTAEEPKLFKGDVLVKINETSIKQFVRQVHCEENFWTGESALRPDIPQSTLDSFSKEFYEEISEAVPKRSEETRHRWDFFTLHLPKDAIDSLAAPDWSGNEHEIIKHIRENSQVIRKFGEALRHFNYEHIQPNLTLDNLITRWEGAVKDKHAEQQTSREWIRTLYCELWRSINNFPSEPSMELMYSPYFGANWRCYMVVNQIRVNRDDSMDFDVYIYKMPADYQRVPRAA